jgi:hypothetical protein
VARGRRRRCGAGVVTAVGARMGDVRRGGCRRRLRRRLRVGTPTGAVVPPRRRRGDGGAAAPAGDLGRPGRRRGSGDRGVGGLRPAAPGDPSRSRGAGAAASAGRRPRLDAAMGRGVRVGEPAEALVRLLVVGLVSACPSRRGGRGRRRRQRVSLAGVLLGVAVVVVALDVLVLQQTRSRSTAAISCRSRCSCPWRPARSSPAGLPVSRRRCAGWGPQPSPCWWPRCISSACGRAGIRYAVGAGGPAWFFGSSQQHPPVGGSRGSRWRRPA